MGTGFNTLDVIMLLVALFVVFAALRTPIAGNNPKPSAMMPDIESGGRV
jgi:hypothetical protein